MGVVEHVTRYAPLNVHVSKHSAPHHCVHILSAQYDISSTDSRTPKFDLMNEVCGADVTTTACIYGGTTIPSMFGIFVDRILFVSVILAVLRSLSLFTY